VFTNSTTYSGSGSVTYHWTYGDTNTYSGTQETHQYANAGVYTVSLRATGPYGDDTETKTGYITVTATPACFGFFIMNDRMRAI
jgi:PKD repeat protein